MAPQYVFFRLQKEILLSVANNGDGKELCHTNGLLVFPLPKDGGGGSPFPQLPAGGKSGRPHPGLVAGGEVAGSARLVMW